MMNNSPPTFEQAMQELEQTVARLEAGNLPLEETLALYERGQALSEMCNRLLEAAELRIQQINPAGGGNTLAPLDDVEDRS
jgi:exodeoxyribonuclease VII small subunit